MTLREPPLARVFRQQERSLAFSSFTRPRKLLATAPASVRYLAHLGSAQRMLQGRIHAAIPSASVRWRYSVVLNGLAVTVPRSSLARLDGVPGVEQVWPSVRYRALLDHTPQLIHASDLWGTNLATAGNGLKVGIIDDGIDQTHPFFSPRGYTYPAGFPKGQRAYTTPKVIAARAFAPARPSYRNARKPFDKGESEHGTHVAGIVAGNNNTPAQGDRISGVAPRAYLGNYKALSIPTPGFGLNGNSPELAKAVDAAVRDGMDVINLSLGEPEIEPSRDLVVRALNAAADAGVVPVVAAGNDYSDFGAGSITSPGSAAKAITVAAATTGAGVERADVAASFSSAGPTPYSLLMKPDVTAPGVGVVSSVPRAEGLYAAFSGTSMASPHVAGGAALLLQRHRSWTVAQVKSALVSTGVRVEAAGAEAPSTRQGGGRVDLLRANDPLLFTSPVGLSFGLVAAGESATRTLALTDAGGGAGTWNVSVVQQSGGDAAAITAPPTVMVPGTLVVRAQAAATARAVDVTGFVVLSRNGQSRRVPFWLAANRPLLAQDPHRALSRPGTYSATTVGAAARVSTYRYPDLTPNALGFPIRLDGPEIVYRVRISRRVANFGVAVVSQGRGVAVEPRIVQAGDENRLAGYTALPLDVNPYRRFYGAHRLVAAVVLPAPGLYDLVFDSTRSSRPGRFAFRYWVGDTRPPGVRLLSTSGRSAVFAVGDRGSGVDRTAVGARVDGRGRRVTWRGDRAYVSLAALGRGRHTLRFSVADRQETKNMENSGPILPNTRVLRTTFVR